MESPLFGVSVRRPQHGGRAGWPGGRGLGPSVPAAAAAWGREGGGAAPGLGHLHHPGHPHHLRHPWRLTVGLPRPSASLENGLPVTPKTFASRGADAPPCVARGPAERACLPVGLLSGEELVGEPELRPKARRPAQLGRCFLGVETSRWGTEWTRRGQRRVSVDSAAVPCVPVVVGTWSVHPARSRLPRGFLDQPVRGLLRARRLQSLFRPFAQPCLFLLFTRNSHFSW